MEPTELKDFIEEKIKKQFITSKLLLGKCRLIDENSRSSSAFIDPSYLPFYYYLGRYMNAYSVMEIGFRLGLSATCFLRACSSVKNYFAFQEKLDTFYSFRLGVKNVKDFYKGKIETHYGQINDDKMKNNNNLFDLCIINEEKDYDKHLSYLDYVWERTNYDGLIIMDYINFYDSARRAYFDFCNIKNRDPIIVKTRYGVGLIKR